MHEIITRRKLAAINQQFRSDIGQHQRSFPDHFQKNKPQNLSLHTYALWVSDVCLRYLSHLILMELRWWKGGCSYPHSTNEETVSWRTVTCLTSFHSMVEPEQEPLGFSDSKSSPLPIVSSCSACNNHSKRIACALITRARFNILLKVFQCVDKVHLKRTRKSLKSCATINTVIPLTKHAGIILI